MDLYQRYALELEIQQLDRFRNTSPEKRNTFYEAELEIDQLYTIRRYRRMSTTYNTEQK